MVSLLIVVDTGGDESAPDSLFIAIAISEEYMELKLGNLSAASEGQHVKIQANGHTFYLLGQQAYDVLERLDCGVTTKQEMDLLANETNALISADETDGY